MNTQRISKKYNPKLSLGCLNGQHIYNIYQPTQLIKEYKALKVKTEVSLK